MRKSIGVCIVIGLLLVIAPMSTRAGDWYSEQTVVRIDAMPDPNGTRYYVHFKDNLNPDNCSEGIGLKGAGARIFAETENGKRLFAMVNHA